MAGGVGARLWPLSTPARPKQFLPLVGKESLLKNSLKRVKGLASPESCYVVTRPSQRHLAEREWDRILVEPAPQGTAPAISFCLSELKERGCAREDVLCFFPADHFIPKESTSLFHHTIHQAVAKAQEKPRHLVMVGITPRHAHTGLGYLEVGEGDKVVSFKEKPDAQRAKHYVSSGRYLWNGGMFVGTWRAFHEHVEQFCPEFPPEGLVSFDHAVLEHSAHLLFVRADFEWSDIGNWKSLMATWKGQLKNFVQRGSPLP